MYNGKGVETFIDYITQFEHITKLTQCPEVQLSKAEAEGHSL